MDLVTFAFLALIALVSGGIAYFADWLGRKLGKKRLRLGRLRPKHTAALGVVSSGFLISVFTIGLVYASSSDVRQWIQEGRIAIRKLNDAVAQREAADRDREQIDRQNKGLQRDSALRKLEIGRARATLKQLDAKTLDLQKQIAANRVAALKLRRKLDAVQAQFLASTASLTATEAQRTQAEHALADIRKQYVGLQNLYHGLTSSYAELSSKSKDIEAYNTKVTKDNIALITSNAELQAKRDDLETKYKEVADSLVRLNSEIDAQTTQLTENATELRLFQEERLKLDNSVAWSREHPLTFSAHEELARISLPAHIGASEVRDAITNLLRSARTLAESRGAKGRGVDMPAAAIFQREDPRTQQEVPPEAIIGNMVRRVAGRPSEQVLVATSTYNAFEGEPVSIDLTAYPNPLIYKGGQVVAETRIDGTSSEQIILARITEFLRQKVRDRVKTDHLLPSSDDSFGNVDGGQIIKIVKNVQSAERTVRLQAVARSNTRAGDPLLLELRIR